jgi:hypothetical protein
MSNSPSLVDRAWREVVELHDFFVAWLRGDAPAEDFSRAEAAISKDFRMISPDGKIDDSAAVLEWIKGGARKPAEPVRYRGAGPAHNLGGRGRGLAGIHRATVS